jgi:predicted GNAT family N-acyltransferase
MTELLPTFRLLKKSDPRKEFDCGDEELNLFLHRLALQHQKKNASRTFVAIQENRDDILGFYTLVTSQVALDLIQEKERKKLPRHPIPMICIARLARNLSCKGEGLGELLLMDALARSLRLSEEVGVYAIEVKAKHEKAREFYLKYGFTSLEDDSLHLYLPMKQVRQVFSG